jgi:hypothetical protein
MEQLPLPLEAQEPSYRTIPLTQGQFAIVDAGDYDWLNQWKWCAQWDPRMKSFYAYRLTSSRDGMPRKKISMHALVAQTEKGEHTDHVNKNTIDNRRLNLRRATCSQNQQNSKVRRAGLKGIWKDKNRWKAGLTVNRKKVYLGCFKTPEEAHAAYIEGAKKYHGEFASW